LKTETGEIISKKEALVREAMECGFQRFEAEAFYNCLRRFQQHEREVIAQMIEDLEAWNMDDPASTAADAIRERGQA
jgi:hypothetical protein